MNANAVVRVYFVLRRTKPYTPAACWLMAMLAVNRRNKP